MKWLSLSALVIVLDQLSKYLADQYLALHHPVPVFPGFNLTLMHNTGAAFSFLSSAGGWQRWFFIGLGSIISVFLVTWIHRLDAQQRWLACSLSLILGGALGNLLDRVVLSYVIDFIDVYYNSWHWPAFNIADSAITVGAVMLIIESFWMTDKKSQPNR